MVITAYGRLGAYDTARRVFEAHDRALTDRDLGGACRRDPSGARSSADGHRHGTQRRHRLSLRQRRQPSGRRLTPPGVAYTVRRRLADAGGALRPALIGVKGTLRSFPGSGCRRCAQPGNFLRSTPLTPSRPPLDRCPQGATDQTVAPVGANRPRAEEMSVARASGLAPACRSVLRSVEEVDRVGDDAEAVVLGAVVVGPLAVAQGAADGDETSFAQVPTGAGGDSCSSS